MARSRPANVSSRRSSSLQARLDEQGMILLFDGTCGLCNRAVQWILRHDPGGSMHFAPLESALGREALARLPGVAGIDSMILLHREGAWVKSTAALEIARYVGGIWGLGVIGYVVPRSMRDWVYDQVAKRRTTWFGRTDQCLIPSPEQRARFHLD